MQLNPAHPGLQFHRLDRARDPNFWSVRVSRDIRLIVHRTDTSLLLCYVAHHDNAYQWAERRKLETHPKTGAAQLVPAIYEAAFTFDGARIRVDVLSRNSGDTFDLVEVKSSTSVKSEHIPDAAIQLHVVEGSGLPVRKVFLLHIDNSYVYEGGPYDLSKLFRLEDITDPARTFLASIPGSLV